MLIVRYNITKTQKRGVLRKRHAPFLMFAMINIFNIYQKIIFKNINNVMVLKGYYDGVVQLIG